ncbi:MAG: hypothetical protein EG823_02415 [Actinobacteria bacterium]|nr:hypothetical protein [Actinomycetota bacterium]
MSARTGRRDYSAWLARLAVAAVFAVNIECALAFVLRPDRYAGGLELAGVPGQTAVRGLGIAFLMWNATYPPVIWRPKENRTLFAVVLTQQTVGLAGEAWLRLGLPVGHTALASTLERFAVFDAAGLVVMAAAFVALHFSKGGPPK